MKWDWGGRGQFKRGARPFSYLRPISRFSRSNSDSTWRLASALGSSLLSQVGPDDAAGLDGGVDGRAAGPVEPLPDDPDEPADLPPDAGPRSERLGPSERKPPPPPPLPPLPLPLSLPPPLRPPSVLPLSPLLVAPPRTSAKRASIFRFRREARSLRVEIYDCYF